MSAGSSSLMWMRREGPSACCVEVVRYAPG